jgi:hypothetical protein
VKKIISVITCIVLFSSCDEKKSTESGFTQTIENTQHTIQLKINKDKIQLMKDFRPRKAMNG